MRNSKNTQKQWLVLAWLLFCLVGNAQSWQWAASGGGTDALGSGYEEVYSMYTSASGSTYIASEVGRISLQVKGNPKNTYSTFGLNDWIIAGFSCEGNYKWSKVIGSYYGASRVHLGGDLNGNVYAACRVYSTAPNAIPPTHFDSDVILSSSANNINTFKQTMFLIKYDSNGNYLWHRTPQAIDIDRTTGNGASTLDLEVDALGNSYWLCLLAASSYGNGQYVTTQKGIHILKYDSDGNFIAGFPMDMSINQAPYAFKMKRDPNNGNFYIGGEYNMTSGLSFGGQPVMHSKFVAAFNSTGNLLWERENNSTLSFGDGGVSFDVAVDTDGSVYFIGATGYVGDLSVPDSFNGVPFVHPGSVPPWPFIVKLDATGNTIWQTCGRQCSLRSVAVNGDEVAVSSGANFLTWQNQTFQNPSSGNQPFIARFNKSDGQIIAINKISSNGDDFGTALTADAHGNYYVGGRFAASLPVGTETINSRGGQTDFFVAKFGQSNCNLSTTTFDNNKVKVYPNPVRTEFFVEGIDEADYEIYDVLGHKVQSGKLREQQSINIQNLTNGVYFVKLNSSCKMETVKITKL